MKHQAPSFKTIAGGVTTPKGFKASSTCAGIKQSKKADIGLLVSDTPCSASGALTTNKVRAACVNWAASILPGKSVRAVFCNSGNANACTGKRGDYDTRTIASLIAKNIGCKTTDVLVASTGVIGHYLPMEKISAKIPSACSSIATTNGQKFAEAIMTTDTVRKECALAVESEKGAFRIGGACKGSGMIHPNMATMLAFVTTDAAIAPAALNTIVKRCVSRTFNNLSVDGDTSTNDMVLVLASGASGVKVSSKSDLVLFEQALVHMFDILCQKIAADGEGATKRIEICVSGAKTEGDARKALKAISNSCLVKTAMFGNDPNWGRIACAVGYSGANFNEKAIEIALNGTPVFKAMRPVEFSAKKLSASLKDKVVYVDVDLGQGKAVALGQTCDLTYDYIKINADYHT